MESNDWDAGCAGYRRLPRRDFLRVGALSALGLTLPDLLRLEAASAGPAREMSCILIWLRGGPSSIDMWDLKPEAPAAVRCAVPPNPNEPPRTPHFRPPASLREDRGKVRPDPFRDPRALRSRGRLALYGDRLGHLPAAEVSHAGDGGPETARLPHLAAAAHPPA